MTRLSNYFTKVIAKRLSAVEIDRFTSNQHEFNGTKAMKDMFGKQKQYMPTRQIYLGQDEDYLCVDSLLTWYESRKPPRSEYRLYYQDNEVLNKANTGDILILAYRHDQSLVLLVVDAASQDLPNTLWLFGIREQNLTGKFSSIDPDNIEQGSLTLFTHIAEAIGLEVTSAADDWLDLLLERFPDGFPTTRELSKLAQETLAHDISLVEAPDNALIALMDREEELFRQLEQYTVSRELQKKANSWVNDVDSFISFSLSVHNRRKSRAGHALENQLEQVFSANSVQYERGPITENRSRPDFLFPDSTIYHNDTVSARNLTMLGVKTTCKDRWRQVLNEADRIPNKHLLTLQPGISENQTREMQTSSLSLVIPASLHTSYTEAQRSWLLSLSDFISLVHEKERWLIS